MDKYRQLNELIASLEGDFGAFYEGSNQAAGTRVRKGMQEVKNLAQEIRVNVQAIKNAAS